MSNRYHQTQPSPGSQLTSACTCQAGFLCHPHLKLTPEAVPGVQSPVPTATVGHGARPGYCGGVWVATVTCACGMGHSHGEVGVPTSPQGWPWLPSSLLSPPAPTQPQLQAGVRGCRSMDVLALGTQCCAEVLCPAQRCRDSRGPPAQPHQGPGCGAAATGCSPLT